MVDPDEVVRRIIRFVYYVAGNGCSTNVPLMDFDEVVGELLEEVAKGIKRYGDKPMEELLAILRKMCDNRISELKYKYCVTHRVAAIGTFPITVVEIDPSPGDSVGGKSSPGYRWVMDNAVFIDETVASNMRVLETRRRLSPLAKDVFDVIVYGDKNVETQLLLSGIRSSHVFKSGGTVRVKPWHIADALCIPIADVKAAYSEIKVVYRKVVEEWTI